MSVWENRLRRKFGPDWEILSRQLIGNDFENYDLSDVYNSLIGQCQTTIKKCEVCDNWSIVKGDPDHENAHWAG